MEITTAPTYESAPANYSDEIIHPEDARAGRHPQGVDGEIRASIDVPLQAAGRQQIGPAPYGSGNLGIQGDVAVTPMSPDEIYEYVRMRLQDIDGQIKDLQGDANDKKKRSDQFRAFQQAVRSLMGEGTGDSSYNSWSMMPSASTGTWGVVTDKVEPPTDKMAKQDAEAKARLEAAKSECADNPALLKRLNELENEIDTKHTIPGDELQRQLDFAKDELTAINSGNELTMMRLNTLFQLRSQIITSGTNEQAAINDGVKAIISNMRA